MLFGRGNSLLTTNVFGTKKYKELYAQKVNTQRIKNEKVKHKK